MRQIPIYVSNRQGFVWTVDDLTILRSTCRVCGSLTGTLPSAAQQNVFLGLPLMLMPEEVVLLVEKRLAYLVHDTASQSVPTREHLRFWNTKRTEDIARQRTLKEEKLSKPKEIKLTDEALARRAARGAKRAHMAAAAPAVDGQGDIFEPPAPVENEESADVSKEVSHWVRVPSTSTEEPWYNPLTYESLDDARQAQIWTYPSTEREHALCAVYQDLWEMGYYMGSGLKFGGDYLVYPGDPLRYHSHFVATVFSSPVSLLRPMDIIAFGRLGTATKKAHLLCGWDKTTGEASYFSIEWANFG